MHSLSKFIYTRILGWELVGVFPTLPKYIVAVVPHTSLLDFFIGLLVRSISRETINFVGKKELVNPLTAWFFRGLGGAPIDRSGNKGSVESMVAVFKAHDKFRIALIILECLRHDTLVVHPHLLQFSQLDLILLLVLLFPVV